MLINWSHRILYGGDLQHSEEKVIEEVPDVITHIDCEPYDDGYDDDDEDDGYDDDNCYENVNDVDQVDLVDKVLIIEDECVP